MQFIFPEYFSTFAIIFCKCVLNINGFIVVRGKSKNSFFYKVNSVDIDCWIWFSGENILGFDSNSEKFVLLAICGRKLCSLLKLLFFLWRSVSFFYLSDWKRVAASVITVDYHSLGKLLNPWYLTSSSYNQSLKDIGKIVWPMRE